ncbi:glycosyltransferase family 4 protein [Iningainema tapete]|uniref:Glycosyltransferase family 4 protein n=1 Tax=Iningainema tapete BLCC-T55 TaxID=2748662 RepID=A0A8J7BWT3_9CYAN|nr:glycosyltransferase family 4 protein [Iningainema tapete]MBD2771528.1 glycosyltransferase family 4 protein [Iningainema tapete BLCC-T55]
MNKHILLHTDDPGIGEVAQYNHTLLCGLAALGYRLTCVQSQSSNPMVSVQKQLGIEHLWLDFDTISEPERAISDQSCAEKIFVITKPDLIIFSDTCPFSNSGAKYVAIQQGIPFIVVIGLVDHRAPGTSSLILNELSRFYRCAMAVIALSKENLNLLHQLYGLPENKGQVIYPGIPAKCFARTEQSVCDRLREQLSIPQNGLVCFTSAPLEAVKGYNYQLAAMQKLKGTEVWDSLYFIWVGSGELENQLRFLLNQLQITNDKVKMLGKRWDIPDLLDASDIFILTSIIEGMPLSIMEAMAKGLPVIATAVSGVPEQLGDTGKLLPDPKIDPHATVNELVTTIQAWFANLQLRHQSANACKTRAQHLFKEERMISETHALIESVFNIEQQVKAMMKKALNLLNSSNSIEAALIAEQAANLGINIPEMHFVRAICLSANNHNQQAFEAAKAELEINPTHRPSQEIVDNFSRKMYGQMTKIPRQKNPRINVVIFSKDRACQLELLLRSFKKYFTEWEQAEKTVIYKAEHHTLEQGYQLCQKLHPEFSYVSESSTPFKQATSNAINENNALTMFLVDDIVFKEQFSLQDPEFKQFSNDLKILCLSLRLYPKVNYCYVINRHVSVPQFREDGVWRWVDSEGDWGYPMSLDGNIFSTPIIQCLTENLQFYNPNSFEILMARNAKYLENTPFMLCYQENSKLLNIPANKVQDTCPARFGNLITPEELNQRFLNGERILLEPFIYQQNNAVHVELPYNFEKIK